MGLIRDQIDLHRWADDGGIAERAQKMYRATRQRNWLNHRNRLDAIRKELGRSVGHASRRLEVSR